MTHVSFEVGESGRVAGVQMEQVHELVRFEVGHGFLGLSACTLDFLEELTKSIS